MAKLETLVIRQRYGLKFCPQRIRERCIAFGNRQFGPRGQGARSVNWRTWFFPRERCIQQLCSRFVIPFGVSERRGRFDRLSKPRLTSVRLLLRLRLAAPACRGPTRDPANRSRLGIALRGTMKKGHRPGGCKPPGRGSRHKRGGTARGRPSVGRAGLGKGQARCRGRGPRPGLHRCGLRVARARLLDVRRHER